VSLVATSIIVEKMFTGSALACNKDVKVVHAAKPMKKKNASTTIVGENGEVDVKCNWSLNN
jgi:hypothetical protein